jgi:hypothetical protein
MLQTVLILLTHCGHEPGRNTATQQSPALRGVLSFQWETRGACSARPDLGNSVWPEDPPVPTR